MATPDVDVKPVRTQSTQRRLPNRVHLTAFTQSAFASPPLALGPMTVACVVCSVRSGFGKSLAASRAVLPVTDCTVSRPKDDRLGRGAVLRSVMILETVDLLEELRLRRQARMNYVSAFERRELHPVVQDELEAMDRETSRSRGAVLVAERQNRRITVMSISEGGDSTDRNTIKSIDLRRRHVGHKAQDFRPVVRKHWHSRFAETRLPPL